MEKNNLEISNLIDLDYHKPIICIYIKDNGVCYGYDYENGKLILIEDVNGESKFETLEDLADAIGLYKALKHQKEKIKNVTSTIQ